MTEDAFLAIEGLTKRFDQHLAVADLSLSIARGAVLALLGPSGSGKTTTLRLLAGFERPDSGVVRVEGRDVTPLRPAERRFGMVFQHYALFPHLTVGENIAFGLRALDPEARRRRVAEVLGLVDLPSFAHRAVDQLSGGQQQRIALARALAPEPTLLLLDEPLSNLDPTLRERTRRELKAALAKVGITTVLVTHEQEEAFALGDQVAVLHDGRLEQVGTPEDLYQRPASLFVARFVGRAGTVPGEMVAPDRVRIADGVVWPATSPAPLEAGRRVTVVIRPEAARFDRGGGIEGTVRDRRYVGARTSYTVDVAGGTIEVEAGPAAARPGDRVRVIAETALVFPDET